MTLELKEYAWNGTNFVAGGTLVIDPTPNNIGKSCKVEWLSRFSGLYAIYPKAKYRYRRTVEFTLTGGCTPEKMQEIEFYSMRYSKFFINNVLANDWEQVRSPEYYSDRNTNPSGHPWDPNFSTQVMYVMFTECNYTFEEGKNWCTYTIKLQIMGSEQVLP